MSSPTAAGQPTLGRYVLLREIARSNDIVWEGVDPTDEPARRGQGIVPACRSLTGHGATRTD